MKRICVVAIALALSGCREKPKETRLYWSLRIVDSQEERLTHQVTLALDSTGEALAFAHQSYPGLEWRGYLHDASFRCFPGFLPDPIGRTFVSKAEAIAWLRSVLEPLRVKECK
jgi:hypothetical protein